MNKDKAHLLGLEGESMAVKHLQSREYKILERNWRHGRIELDIITEKDKKVVFVEVKTRENRFLGEPWEAVTMAKQRRIIKAANAYLVENEVDNEAQFDIISIILNKNNREIEHLENAFYAMV